MQLSPPPRDEVPADLATGLASFASSLGQRPAVSVVSDDGRAEQGYVTLAQWAAKGAHLLLTDSFAGPEDVVLVDLPPSWQLAAVCAAVWWVGGTVTTDLADAAAGVVAGVVHESADAPAGVDPLYVVGDAPDGGTTEGGAGAAPGAVGSWAEEVQAFPDQPPPSAASGDGTVLLTPTGPVPHAELVATLRADTRGTLGIDLGDWDGDAIAAVTLVAARPLATGDTTLVLATGTDRAAVTGDRVAVWA